MFAGSFAETPFRARGSIITFIFVVACAGLRNLNLENVAL
jgi:hypothetical protein